MRLAKLTTEKEKTESELSKCKSENENVASLPKTFVELNKMIDGVLDNQDIRRKVANVVPTLVRKITLDIADKFNPSFNVHLINGEQINWEYDINEFSQPIIGIGKNGGFILGKGKVLDGNYSIKGNVKTP